MVGGLDLTADFAASQVIHVGIWEDDGIVRSLLFFFFVDDLKQRGR